MKKINFLFLLNFIAWGAMAQIPSNITVSDCAGLSKNIHNVLGSTGKSIIVMSKGVDCSSCMGSAPGWQNWAGQNTTKVEVWAAMTYRYNPASFSPACTAISNWENSYNWTDIFAFPDNNRDFVEIAMPRYYVYSPQDSSIAYAGFSASVARSTALQASIVGISENDLLDEIQIQIVDRMLSLSNIPEEVSHISIYQINGQLTHQLRDPQSRLEQNLSELPSGLYVLHFQAGKKSQSLKISLL